MTETSPIDTLRWMNLWFLVSRAIQVAAALGVADHLNEEPQSVAKLAQATGAKPDALFRLLRLLSSYGIFILSGEQVSHTDVSRLLRKDHPQSRRADILWTAFGWSAFGDLEYTIRTGKPSIERQLPDGYWEYFKAHPEMARIFDESMTAKASIDISAILDAYDFSAFKVIGDIGGGQGRLIRAILNASAKVHGILFDRPDVVGAIKDPGNRLTLQGGDFFKGDLPACNAYLLMDVIHDWEDGDAIAILKSVRRAAPTGAKLLVIEGLISSDPGVDWIKIIDLAMIALGGRQRTAQDFERLLGAAGFHLERVIPTRSDPSIVEAMAV